MNYEELSGKAKFKADIVKDVIENGSALNYRRRACNKLCVSEKTLSRYIKGCKEGRYEVFVHGNTGKTPVTVIKPEQREEIIKIYLEEYPNASFTHFREILKEDYGIDVSPLSGMVFISTQSRLCSLLNCLISWKILYKLSGFSIFFEIYVIQSLKCV